MKQEKRCMRKNKNKNLPSDETKRVPSGPAGGRPRGSGTKVGRKNGYRRPGGQSLEGRGRAGKAKFRRILKLRPSRNEPPRRKRRKVRSPRNNRKAKRRRKQRKPLKRNRKRRAFSQGSKKRFFAGKTRFLRRLTSARRR